MTNPTSPSNRRIILLAWAILLLGSSLPDILWVELLKTSPAWLLWARLGVFAVLAALSLVVKPLRPVRPFVIVLFTLYAAPAALARLNFGLPFVQAWLGDSAFIRDMQPEQFNKLAVSLVMIAVLFLLGYRRAQMFLVRGQLNAPIQRLGL